MGWCFHYAVHVFSNLFLKICPLFGQILITCLKCSRASFSLSSYSEKMHWGGGWQKSKHLNSIRLFPFFHFIFLLNKIFKRRHRNDRKLSPQPVTLLKKRLCHSCFPVDFAKFLRTRFLTEHLQWLLLKDKKL